MKILIRAMGFIGDNLFGSSVAKKLSKQHIDCEIDYKLSIVQPFELISLNPFIDNVYLDDSIINNTYYDKVYQLQPIHRLLTPCEELQLQCEINDPSSDYEIYTNKSLNEYVSLMFRGGRNKKLIAWMSNWEERSFLFTEDEYNRGINVPNLGYGGKRRNIQFIINELSKCDDIILIEVGKPNGYKQWEADIQSVSEYTLTASIIKNCDYFIGAEGGLCNLAAGVGTKTIITGDFVHQLYGPNGVLEKNEEPKLGPKYYFKNQKHVTLNPYLTDCEVIEKIKENII